MLYLFLSARLLHWAQNEKEEEEDEEAYKMSSGSIDWRMTANDQQTVVRLTAVVCDVRVDVVLDENPDDVVASQLTGVGAGGHASVVS